MSGTDNSLKDAWVTRVLGVAPGGSGSGASPSLDKWTSARASVITTLKDLEDSIRSMDDPQGDDAIILVRAIAANLTAEPTTRQQIDELKRYLQSDPIIDDAESPNGFGIHVQIREPLMSALLAMETSP
jgi:hypothetical protein